MIARKNILSLIVVTFLFIAIIGGCGNGSGGTAENAGNNGAGKEKVVLDAIVWKPEATEGYEALAKKFNELNPNIEITYVGIQNYEQNLKARLAANNPPVLIGVPGGNYGLNLAKAGQLLDITGQKFLERVRDGVIDGTEYKDKVYSLPVDLAAHGIIYNKKVFNDCGVAEVPKTWDEFIAVCEKIKEKGITPIVITGKDEWTLGISMVTLAAPIVYGPNPTFDMDAINGSKSYTGPEWSIVMQRYEQLKKYSNSDLASMDYSTGNQMVALGKAAMTIQGIWVCSAIRQSNPDVELGMFLPPPADGQTKETMIFGPDFTLGVSSKTKYADEALKFLEFLTTDEAAKIWTDKVQTISAIKNSSMDFDPVTKDVSRFLSQDIYTYPLPNHMWFSQDVFGQYSKNLQQMNLGRMSSTDAQKGLEDLIKNAYKNFME